MNRTIYLATTTLAFLVALQLALVTDVLAGSRPATPERPSRPAEPATPATPAQPATPASPAAPAVPATPATPADPRTGICESLAGHPFQPAFCVEDEESDDEDEGDDEENEDDSDDEDDDNSGNDGEDGDEDNSGDEGEDGQDGGDGDGGNDGEDGEDGGDGQDGDDTNTGDETDEETDGNASTTLGHVIITEVLYDLAQDGSQGSEIGGDNEWVEIYNATDGPVDLHGWSIGDGVSNDIIADESLILAAGEFLIITDAVTTANFWDFGSTTVVYLGSSISGGLSNTGDSVILYNASSTAVDGVSYGDSDTAFSPSVADVAAGSSITRTSLIIDTDTAIDWTNNDFPNPGSQI